MTWRSMVVGALLLGGRAFAADETHWTVVGQTSVTFDWRGSESVLTYGTSPGVRPNHVTAITPNPVPFSSAGPFREAKITGLAEDTVYYYAIGNGPEHTFRTPLARGDSGFVVYAQGDIGESVSFPNVTGIQALIAQGLAATAEPALVLAAGDLTYGNVFGQASVDRHFNDVMSWSQDAPYMPAWGNHEWTSPDDLRNYKGRFDLPNPQTSPGSPAVSCCGEDWSWFDYGNVRFIAYPEPWSGALADWQTHAGALMAQAQDDPAISFIVTWGHRPAYSSGFHPGEAALEAILDGFGDSYAKYVLNVNGHSHNYERSFPQHGVVHVTAGTGGANLEQVGSCLWVACAQPDWSDFRAMRQGVLRLRVGPSAIDGAFLCGPAGGGVNDIACAPGGVGDSFTIGLNANGCPAMSVGPATIAAAQAGTPYSQGFTQTGGAGAVGLVLTGRLPQGLSFSAPVLSGTPSEIGRFPFVVTATDANGCRRRRHYALLVASAAGAAPVALSVDAAGNGVWDPGETVAVAPSWWNASGGDLPLSGSVSSLTGPPGATYGITDSLADYGTLPAGASGSCSGDCYSVSVSAPAIRPTTHWDASVAEAVSSGDAKGWGLHVGDSFGDVGRTHAFYRFVEALFHAGVTAGCAAGTYCPSGATSRGEMSVFLLRAQEGAAYVPPPPTGVFADVPPNHPFAAWIEELARRGITSGCGGGNFCPDVSTQRGQMAVFLLRSVEGSAYTPTAAAGTFGDVPPANPFAPWIEELARRGVTQGCNVQPPRYCPDAGVTRGQMSAFLTRAFNLLVYGP